MSRLSGVIMAENLSVLGETGLGKSTFVNTLFHSAIYSNASSGGDASQSKGASQHVLQSSNERWSKVVKEHADKQSTSAATAASTGFCNVPRIVFVLKLYSYNLK